MAAFIDIGNGRYANPALILVASPQGAEWLLLLASGADIEATVFSVPPEFIAGDNGRMINPEHIEYAAPSSGGWLIQMSDGTSITASTFSP